jgi:hypothetical protein
MRRFCDVHRMQIQDMKEMPARVLIISELQTRSSIQTHVTDGALMQSLGCSLDHTSTGLQVGDVSLFIRVPLRFKRKNPTGIYRTCQCSPPPIFWKYVIPHFSVLRAREIVWLAKSPSLTSSETAYRIRWSDQTWALRTGFDSRQGQEFYSRRHLHTISENRLVSIQFIP